MVRLPSGVVPRPARGLSQSPREGRQWTETAAAIRRADGQTGGQTDGQAGGQTDTDRRADDGQSQPDWQTSDKAVIQTGRQIYGQTFISYRQIDKQTDGRLVFWIANSIDR